MRQRGLRLSPKTLAGRLLLAAAVFVAAALVAATVVIGVILQYVVTDQVDQRLEAQIVSLASALKPGENGRLELVTVLDGPPFDRIGSGWYWQIEGEALDLRSRSLGADTLDAPPQAFDWRRVFSDHPESIKGKDANGRSLHVRSLQTVVAGQTITITASAPGSAISGPLRRVMVWLVPAITILGLALLGATLVQIRLGLKPLRALRDDLQSVRQGHLARVPAEQPAELAPVVVELNGLIAQNEQSLATARLHLANLAHGLKTPLASLSLAIRDGDKSDMAAMAALTDRLEARIRHHLRRARANVAGSGQRTRTDVAAKLADLVIVMERIHADRTITCTTAIEDGLYTACDAEDFDEILGNLLDNAFKWAEASVSLTVATVHGMASIVIDDDGPGIPASQLADALQPGRRLDETVAGDGFGLSISRELTELHGGSLLLQQNSAGGLRVSIALPLA